MVRAVAQRLAPRPKAGPVTQEKFGLSDGGAQRARGVDRTAIKRHDRQMERGEQGAGGLRIGAKIAQFGRDLRKVHCWK